MILSSLKPFAQVLTVLDAMQSSVKVALHLEPYPLRSAMSVREDLEYIAGRFYTRTCHNLTGLVTTLTGLVTTEHYGHHQSLLRAKAGDADAEERGRLVYYVYDSYHIRPFEWARLLTPGGSRFVSPDTINTIENLKPHFPCA
jgi:hypothetical protein